jgi:hypothetical protein
LSGQESELKKLVHDFQAKASRTQEAEEKVNQLGSLLKADQSKAKDIISKYKGCLFFSGVQFNNRCRNVQSIFNVTLLIVLIMCVYHPPPA